MENILAREFPDWNKFPECLWFFFYATFASSCLKKVAEKLKVIN